MTYSQTLRSSAIAVAALLIGCAPAQTESPPSNVGATEATVRPAAPPAPEASTCASLPAIDAFSRPVDGAQRACATDADCVSVLNRCGYCENDCAGVHTSFAPSYDDVEMECDGYQGGACNYDCRVHSLGQCVEGCCESVAWYTLWLKEPPKWEDSRLNKK